MSMENHIERLINYVEKTKEINEAGNEIWLNLITREKNNPIFYTLGED